MNFNNLKTALSILSIFFVSNCLAQEVVVETDYSTKRASDFTYCFGGYGLHDDDEHYKANDSLTSKHEESAEGGNDGACMTSTLDTSKSKIPDDTSFDYVGWGCGSYLETKEAFKAADLSKYTISFDAKISGTQTLTASKCFLEFMVADDAVAKDEDRRPDIVFRLDRGEDDGTDTFSITDEYQSFSFNLKDDMRASIGTVEDLTKHEVKMIGVLVQAQGMSWDIGKDADNVLYIDNIKLTMKADKEPEEMKEEESEKADTEEAAKEEATKEEASKEEAAAEEEMKESEKEETK